MQLPKVPEFAPAESCRRRHLRRRSKKCLSRPQELSKLERAQELNNQRYSYCSLFTQAEDLAGIGAWACSPSEMIQIHEGGVKIVAENKNRNADTLNYESACQNASRVSKRIGPETYLHIEFRPSEVTVLGHYLFERESQNLPMQERFFWRSIEHATAKERRRIMQHD